MKLPELSHLQMLVLGALGPRRISGQKLRAALGELDICSQGPAFYQLMSRLEKGWYVQGSYSRKTVNGNTIRERFYHITSSGIEAFHATRAFYQSLSLDP